MADLDEKDRKILELLADNSRTPYTEIGEEVGLTEATVRKRVKHLEEDGVIQKYTIDLDPSKLGYGMVTILGLDVDPQHFLKASENLVELDEVRWAAKSTGDHMIMAEVWAKNGEELTRLMSEEIAKIEGVQKLCPAILLEKMK